jgi:hypothetical protein
MWIENFKIKPEILKLQKVVGKMVEHEGTDNNFLYRAPMAQQIREKIKT